MDATGGAGPADFGTAAGDVGGVADFGIPDYFFDAIYSGAEAKIESQLEFQDATIGAKIATPADQQGPI